MHLKNLEPSREEFDRWTHEALNRLYDSPFLETLPLTDWLVPQEERTGSRSQSLRRRLLSAIQARKPPRGAPPQSRDWRGYQILEQRFIAALTPGEVVQRMNISRSLFFLEQARALKVITDDLWQARIDPAAAPADLPEKPEAVTPPDGPETPSGATEPIMAEADPPEGCEVADLLSRAVFEPVRLRSLLTSFQPIITSLGKARGITFAIQDGGDSVLPKADRVLLRQVIISLVAELAQLVRGGKIELNTFDEPGRFGIRISAHGGAIEPDFLYVEDRQGLDPQTSQEILRAMQGRLEIYSTGAQSFEAVLEWKKTLIPRILLLVDDYTDMADLFRRYLAGQCWQVISAETTEKARQVLKSTRPTVILLDVIMPVEDGWEYLVEIKGDPVLRQIPVIVCSAINEPDLVRSLGADGYLPKPVGQMDLFRALQPWTESLLPTR
jgi:CheY-like chemotaxis protein